MLATIAALLMALSFGVAYANAQSLKEKVANDGTLTIGVHNKWPWGYKGEDGDVTGIYPDVFKAAAAPLGVKKIEFVTMDFGALIPALLARRIDAVASGMVITAPRCEQVIFSVPFHAGGDALLVRQGNPLGVHSYEDVAKNTNVRIGDLRGASTTTNAVAAGVSKDRIQLFPDNDALVSALLTNRIDAALFASGTAIGILKDSNVQGIERALPFTGLVQNGKEVKTYGAIEFRPEDAEFRDLFDESLEQQKADGKVLDIMQKYSFTADEVASDGVTAKELCGTAYR